MKKIVWLCMFLCGILYAQLDLTKVDVSQLTPEQLSAYKAYLSNSSNTKIKNQKQFFQSQTIENEIDFSDQNNMLYQATKKELPIKNLDLSPPIPPIVDNNVSEEIFKTPLQYKTNEEMYKTIQKDKIKTETKELKKFGESFFSNKNSVNPYAIPTSKDYIVTNGDKLSANIYGQQASSLELLVDRNGNVDIPNIGVVKVGGLNFIDAKSTILEHLTKAYPQSTIVLDMSYYSAIQVVLTGEVKSPGLYNLPSFSTIKDLLMVANGINESGTYRNIIVKRDGKVIENFDAYKTIQFGEDKTPKLLRNGDVVVVGKAQKQVYISGHVSTPGIFELTSEETFKHLFDFASHFKFDANKNMLQLTRYVQNEKIKVYTLSFEKLLSMKPENGDKIEVFPLSTLAKKTVYLKGNIIQEGERELPLDQKLSTVLQKEVAIYGKNNFFLENTAFDFAMVKRKNISGSDQIIPFNIEEVLTNQKDIAIKEGDEIHIFSKLQLGENPYVYVEGKVVDKEGRYQYFEGMDLSSLFRSIIFKTELIEFDVNTSNIQKQDLNISKLTKTKAIHVNKNYIKLTRINGGKTETRALDLKKDSAFQIKAFDRVEFFDIYHTSKRYFASVSGEVFNPGTFDLQENTTVKDIINYAGGLTKKAYLKDVEIARYKIVDDQRVRNVITLDLNDEKNQNIALQDGDQIIIRAIPKWGEAKYIDLVGQVKFPGKYPIEDGETLADVIERAGGLTELAFEKATVFTRKSVQELQQKELLKSLHELKQKTAYLASVPSETKESNAENTKLLLAMVESLEKDAKTTVPIGRVVLAIEKEMSKFRKTPYNVPLEDGDKLYIPKINKTVTVVGEVMSSNTFIFDDRLSLDDYIKKAGGFKKETADKSGIYIIKSNGSTDRVESGYFLSSNADIEYGDTIVVPKKIEVTSNISIISAIADITYKMAVTIASLSTVGAL